MTVFEEYVPFNYGESLVSMLVFWGVLISNKMRQDVAFVLSAGYIIVTWQFDILPPPGDETGGS